MDRKDVTIDPSAGNDLLIANGDFLIANSDFQHVFLNLGSKPGHWKQSPLTGAWILDALNGQLDGAKKRDIFVHLKSDGYDRVAIRPHVSGSFLGVKIEP